MLGGSLRVCRIGYGTMQLAGEGAWGERLDRRQSIGLLRKAVDLGVNFLDTADSYGPHVCEELIKAALYPYPTDLVIATKGGFVRPRPGEWHVLGEPAYLRQQAEMSLRRLGVDAIDLYQLHRVDPRFPLDDQVGVLAELMREGKIRHIGLSEVPVQTLRQAARTAPISAVQNRYNLTDRAYDDVVDAATALGVAFIPWSPLGAGSLACQGALRRAAQVLEVSAAQLALAWLLHRSPAMLPVPGTCRQPHLAENMQAMKVVLEPLYYEALTGARPSSASPGS